MNVELGRIVAEDYRALADDFVDPLGPAPRSKEAVRVVLYIAMWLSDLILLTASFALAAWLRFGVPWAPQASRMLLLTIPLFLLIAISNHAYASEVLVHARCSVQRALKSLGLVVVATIATAYALRVSQELPRLAIALGFVFATGLLALSRLAFVALAHRLLDGEATSEILIFDGLDHLPEDLAGKTILDASLYGLFPEDRSPPMLDRIGRLIQCYDRVLIACAPDRRFVWARALKGSGANVELLAPELDDIGMLTAGHYRGRVTAVVSLDALGLHDRALKRAFDLVVAVVALPILPIAILLVGLALKLETPGPVFFVQTRVGWGNRLFKMYKFRTMTASKADHLGKRSASRQDERVTRVGRLLRNTSLDELPQLINVLKGDMSIVGPRPHAVASRADNLLFWEVDDRYFNRHAVKPGLTGLAQVRGFRGATMTRSDLSNRVQADLEYLSGWTIWRDIAIIVRTLGVLVHRNAY